MMMMMMMIIIIITIIIIIICFAFKLSIDTVISPYILLLDGREEFVCAD
jgi:hypothetical protein